MFSPPGDVDLEKLIMLIRDVWRLDLTSLDYQAVGFGAHHWRGQVEAAAPIFVTLDQLGPKRTLDRLRATYASAAELAALGLEFVHAPLPPYAVAFDGRAVSLTPWLDATGPDRLDRDATATILQRLHQLDPGALSVGLDTWRPVVGIDLPDRLIPMAGTVWTGGPYGEQARSAVLARTSEVQSWTSRYHELVALSQTRPWVPTHGEPGQHNQLITPAGIVLVDWESLKLAPAERDLRTLGTGDQQLLEMFDLEWRLDEISQYADWFAGPHGDSADDRVAYEGLIHELQR